MAPSSIPLEELGPSFAHRPDLAELWQRLQASASELAIVTAVRPDLAPLWEIARVGKLDELTPKQRAELLLGKSIINERDGQFTQGIKCAQQVIEFGQAAGWDDLIAGGYACQSSYYYDLGNYALAQAKARAALERDSHGVPAVISLNALGLCAAESAEMDIEQAADYFHRAAELSRALDYPLGYAMALNWRGDHVYRVRGELDLMLASCDEAARILSKLNFPFNGHYYARAYYFWLKGNRENLKVVLENMQALGPRSSFAAMAHAYYAVMLALDEEDYPKAAQALAPLREIASTTGHLECECWLRLATSRYQLLTGEPQSAVSWARDAIQTARRKESRYFELSGHLAYARAALEMDDAALCREQLQAATQIAMRLGGQLDLAVIHLLRAVLEAREHQAEAASTWLEAARRITQGGYGFILERERELAFPLVATYAKSRHPEIQKSAEQMLDQLARIPPLPLRVYGLGRFEVWQGRRKIPDSAWQKRRAGELFRFLLLQPQATASRDVVCEALVPDASAESAQTFLHHATSTLRRILEPDLPDKFPSRYLTVEQERLSVNLPSDSWLDFQTFQDTLRAASVSATELNAVLKFYGGDLFPLDRYADWSVEARERLAELHRRALSMLAAAQLGEGKPQAALDACRAILASDPWSEDAVLLGMRACLALDDRPAALKLYRALEHVLRADLNLSPRKDLATLARSLTDE